MGSTMWRAAAMAVVLGGCGASALPAPPVTAIAELPGSELIGCYRVDASAGPGARVVGREPGALPAAVSDGAVYCLDVDRYYVRIGGHWNAVLTPWETRPIWQLRVRVGAVWTSAPATRLRSGEASSLCAISPETCKAAPSDADACPLAFTRDSGAFRLDHGAAVPLVPLDLEENRRARAEIAALASVDGVCREAADGVTRELAAFQSKLAGGALDEEPPAPPRLPEGATPTDLDSCRAVLQALAAWRRGDAFALRAEECPGTHVSCPRDARWDGVSCVATHARVECPAGSRRDGDDCVATRVVCPAGTVMTNGRCLAEVAEPPEPPGPGPSAPVRFNSIPPSEVFVDGRAIGQTPIHGIAIREGRHVVRFVNTVHGVMLRTVEVRAGVPLTVVVKFPPAMPADPLSARH